MRAKIVNIRAFTYLFCVIVLAGCAMMRTAHRIDHNSSFPIACDSNAGSYSLPKSLIKLTVLKKPKVEEPSPDAIKKDPTLLNTLFRPERYELQEVKQIRREDPQHTYCLRYRGSITSDDKVFVRKALALDTDLIEDRIDLLNELTLDEGRAPTGEEKKSLKLRDTARKTNLLHIVSTDAIDQSGFIAQILIKTLFSAGAGAGARTSRSTLFGKRSEGRVLDIEFDPFHPAQTAAANEALRDFGFCAILGGYAFNLHTATVRAYCDQPIDVLQQHEPLIDGLPYNAALQEYSRPLADLPRGILYRPEMSYTLYIFQNKNPDEEGGEWILRLKQEVQLENIAPIVAVPVSRTYFAQRQTNLLFVGGVLKNVCTAKTSELLEISKLPLVVVKSIVALPAEIAQLKLNNINNSAQLIHAQQQLITKQSAYLDQLSKPQGSASFEPVRFPDQLKETAETVPEPFKGTDIFNEAVRRQNQLGKFGDGGEKNEYACPQPSYGEQAKTQLSATQ